MDSISKNGATTRWWFLRKQSFWIVAAMMGALTLLHYATPQTRFLPLSMNPLGRHAVERIIFILPIASASFAFGRNGGVVTLILSILIMLPRSLFISPTPTDSTVETIAVAIVGYLVVWMIEVQETEKRLRQEAVSRLKTIHEVTAIVTGSLDIEQVMEGALAKVLEVTAAGTACIYLLDKETHDPVLAVCRGSAQGTPHQAEVDISQRLIRMIVESADPVLVPDLNQMPEMTGGVPGGAGIRSLLAVPLISRERVLGLIYLADTRPHQFAVHDLQLLTAISNEIGVAIENAGLHQDVARQLHVEQRLNEVVKEITSELELDKVLPKVLHIAKELVGADGGAVALYDRTEKLIRYRYLDNLLPELVGVTVPMERGVAGDVVTGGSPVVIDDYCAYENAVPAFVHAGVVSAVGVPLVIGENSFGALLLVSLERRKDYTERDVAILAGIGRQAGIAIENANLYENMRFYLQQITRAQEDERKRIARELHDDTVQSLVVLSRRIEALADPAEPLPDPVVRRIRELLTFAGTVIQSVRRFSQDLRPSILDDLGLVPALEWLTSGLSQTEAIQAVLNIQGEKRRLLPEAELTLFRLVQEAYSNVKKHARAARVDTTIEFTPGGIQLTIIDDGVGFTAPDHTGDLAPSGKLGLIGMFERARLLRGTLSVDSEPGKGTRITISVPT
ncbi:MAG: GAF domain-containing sensor histidine kinase [Anaerolineales bacterium]|nr:GAF domain-containing sensor histidine kinase [Anaerolineales bacterium]